MEEIKHSPLPIKKDNVAKLLSFPDAIKEVIKGKKITRLEWENSEIYGELFEGKLRIFRGDTDSLRHDWIVNDGDMISTDWIVI